MGEWHDWIAHIGERHFRDMHAGGMVPGDGAEEDQPPLGEFPAETDPGWHSAEQREGPLRVEVAGVIFHKACDCERTVLQTSIWSSTDDPAPRQVSLHVICALCRKQWEASDG